MSNLTLPKMTYVTLNGMLANNEAKLRHGALKIAYQTHITRHDGAVTVYHHGNPIAELTEHSITISGSGWNSRTTADRLNAILRDNQTPLPSDPYVTDRLWYSVSSRDSRREYGLLLYGRPVSGRTETLRDIQSQSAHFSRVNAEKHFVLHS